eukprot:gb/GECH01006789.1/.p1 GENE.gb/GECH01006789.1/~~gb/GECH01006789.1/.p1  ORF type:complete len:538 (+),score=105.23 gb/GECH01006789.1/:1-1614(+)
MKTRHAEAILFGTLLPLFCHALWDNGLYIQVFLLIINYILAIIYSSIAGDTIGEKERLDLDRGVISGTLLVPLVFSAQSLSLYHPSRIIHSFLWISLLSSFSHLFLRIIAAPTIIAPLFSIIARLLIGSEIPLYATTAGIVVMEMMLWTTIGFNIRQSFTFGEAFIVSQLFSVLCVNASRILYYSAAEMDQFQVVIFFEVLLGLVLLFSVTLPFITSFAVPRLRRISVMSPRSSIIGTFVVYLIAFLVFVAEPVFIRSLGQEPIQWVYEHVTKDRYHIFLVALWIALLFMFLLPLLMSSEHNHNYHNSKKKKKNEDIEKEKISSDSKLKQILRRKYFHLLAVFMFIPGCILKPSFMYLSYGVALSAMIIFECARLQLNATPIGIRIDTFMRRFTDRRDGGTLILTHIYLLCGCALPLWIEFSSMPTDIPLLEMTAAVGVIILGIGDSMASICGVYFGGIRWPIRDNPKTFIGTLAAFLATLAGTLGMAWSAAVPITPTSVMHYTVTAAAVCVFEAITLQIDNLVLPLLFYALVKVFV